MQNGNRNGFYMHEYYLHLPVPFETCVAYAFERTVIIYALSVITTAAIVGQTLVHVLAIYSIAGESVFTSALERALKLQNVNLKFHVRCEKYVAGEDG